VTTLGSAAQGIELRGGAADEAPGAYKRLDSEVLARTPGTIEILHTPDAYRRRDGRGADTFDPYKD
jgi:tRNA-splicing ligase RtcB